MTAASSGRRLTFLILFLTALVLLHFNSPVKGADSCSATSPCTSSSSPCCSHAGFCGSGALFCGGGCEPLASQSATSCLPMPVCTNHNVTLSPSDYNNTAIFVPVLQYAGNASQALFTLDAGSLAAGPEGVMMQMTRDTLVKLSTTFYILYGEMEVRCRHAAYQGVVATMITMSDVRDEIDWEFTTANSSMAQTNWFPQGRTIPGTGQDNGPASGTLDVSDWVTYGIRWAPDRLQWLINGRVVRSLTRSGSSYPRSPSRLQLSVWAGGNSTNAPGVIAWSGGAIDYSSPQYISNGYYGMEISSVSISCADTSVANLSTIGSGKDGPTSWTFTGANDSSTDYLPAFVLNTDAIDLIDDPSAGALPGQPGYESLNTALPPGGWDGSGDTGIRASSSPSSLSANARKYGIPIAAALAGLIVLWAVIVTIVRRRRKHARTPKKGDPIGGIGPSSYASVPSMEGAGSTGKYIPLRDGIGAGAAGAGGTFGGKKKVVRGGSESEKLGSDYPAAPALLSQGAAVYGSGIGPASGPTSAVGMGGRGGGYSQLNSTATPDTDRWPSTRAGAGAGTRVAGASPRPPQQQSYDLPASHHNYLESPGRPFPSNRSPLPTPRQNLVSPVPGQLYSASPAQPQAYQHRGWSQGAASPHSAYSHASPYPSTGAGYGQGQRQAQGQSQGQGQWQGGHGGHTQGSSEPAYGYGHQGGGGGGHTASRGYSDYHTPQYQYR